MTRPETCNPNASGTAAGKRNTDSTISPGDPQHALKGLTVHVCEGLVVFDRPTPVRRMATATLRGLAGHALRQTNSSLVESAFKPGEGGNQPAAYTFQALHREAEFKEALPFRLLTWDAGAELMPALRDALSRVPGWPFGESGACIERVEWSEMGRLHFALAGTPPESCCIRFVSPLSLRSQDRWITERDLSVGHLVSAAVRRINELSIYYGNGVQLAQQDFLPQAACASITARNLRLVSPARRSSTQGRDIMLAGLVGSVHCTGITRSVYSLLQSAQVFGLGKRTSVGCGCLVLE